MEKQCFFDHRAVLLFVFFFTFCRLNLVPAVSSNAQVLETRIYMTTSYLPDRNGSNSRRSLYFCRF